MLLYTILIDFWECVNMYSKMQEYRKKMFLTAYPLKTAHLASAFSITEIMHVLYKDIMKYDIKNPTWKDIIEVINA